MAGKVLKFQLDYREGGRAMSAPLEISFVSKKCIRWYNEIQEIIYAVTFAWHQFSDLKTKLAAKKAGGQVTESVEELMAEIDRVTEDIAKYKDANIEERRFELIKTILEDNGIDKFNTFDFWDSQVEPSVQNAFIEACAFKDIDKKKVV